MVPHRAQRGTAALPSSVSWRKPSLSWFGGTCLDERPLDSPQETQLSESRHAVVETPLLDDPAVLQAKDGGAAEVHLPSRCFRQATNKKVVEGRPGMGTAANPLADNEIPLGYEVGSP